MSTQPKSHRSRVRKGFSLIEILIAAVILAIVGVGVLTLFSQGTTSIVKTDISREYRFFMQNILAHVNRQSLHKLFFHFRPRGPGGITGQGLNSTLLRDEIAKVDGNNNLVNPLSEMTNPLGFTQEFMNDLKAAGLKAGIEFRFIARQDLGTDNSGGSPYGILHMQAGVATVYLLDRETDDIVAEWNQGIMCPAIVGRPGLKMSSCPAVSTRVQCQYLPILQQFEGGFQLPDGFQNRCNRDDWKDDTPASVAEVETSGNG